MTLTIQQQTSILQLTQVMFNTTPGAIFLDVLGTHIKNGQSLSDLAQFLSGTNLFFGDVYNDEFPGSFAQSFVENLVGDRVSVENKTWAINYIFDRMSAGATQADVISELTQALSAIPESDPDWGQASTYHNTDIAVKIVSRLAGNTITAEEAEPVVNYILDQIASGQTIGAMVEWAITALDNIDHSDPTWGDAAALFDNRVEVSRYYSVDKVGTVPSSFMLQYLLTTMQAGETLSSLMKYAVTLLGPELGVASESAKSSAVLRSILSGVTEDIDSVKSAKAAIDNFLKSEINLYGLDGNNGFRLNETALTNYSDYKVSSAGDFNGDGYDDMIIGADHNDADSFIADTGYLVFGKPSGFGATLDLSDAAGSNGFRIDGITETGDDNFSISNAGDINADGFDDLIMGATSYSSGGSRADAAYVIFGRSAVFNAPLDLSNLSSDDGFRMDGLNLGEDPRDFVSSAGDFNGDGYDDIIIGSPLDEASYLVFGKDIGFDPVLDLKNLSADKGFRLDGVASSHSVSTAGDINGDGFDDLIIGANHANPNGSHSSSSYVIFGTAQVFNAPLDLSSLDGSNGFHLSGVVTGNDEGYSVSNAGDVNGDGFDDVIVGVPSASPNGDASGSSYVVFGRAAGFGNVFDLSSLNGNNGFRLDGEREFFDAGFAVSGIGDFNGDGFDDLMIGAPEADPDGFRVGVSYVVFGKAAGFNPSLKLSNLDGNNGLILKGLHLDFEVGRFVSDAGDVNGDGFDDLIMGVSMGNLDNGTLDLGSSYVVLGGNHADTVTFLGTHEADHLVGTIAAESFVAGDGNDVMIGRGGLDVFHGGAGDDLIEVPKFNFRLADGGAGTDTLAFTGGGLNLDLADMRGKIDGIETIDLTGSGNNALNVNLMDVLNLSDTSNTLKIDGNASDSITGLGNGWNDGGVSGDYHVYTRDAAIILVGINVTTDFV